MLTYLAVGGGVLTLAASIIQLVTTIIQARSQGIKRGDRPNQALELIVRSVKCADEYREAVVMRVERDSSIDDEHIEKALGKAIDRLFKYPHA